QCLRSTCFILLAGHCHISTLPLHDALPISILVIDDEPAVAEATSLMLELEGFDVRIASCAQEALERIAECTPDLLISDYHLRGGDRKSTRLNSSHVKISYAVFCLKKKNKTI